MTVHNSAATNLCADETLCKPCCVVNTCMHIMVCKSGSMQHSGFCCSGDGEVSCTPSSQLLMKSDYTTDGVETLSCDQGRDIAYPEGAPGFVYDPTGYLTTLPGRQVCVRCRCIWDKAYFLFFCSFFCRFFFLF